MSDEPPAGIADDVAAAMEFANRAPSPRKTHPWKLVRTSNSAFEVIVDQHRSRKIADPAARETIISCGVAVGYAEVAIRAMGGTAEVTLLPNPNDEQVVARIALKAKCDADNEAKTAAIAALLGHVTWEQFSPERIDEQHADELVTAAASAGASLSEVDAARAPAVDEMIKESDHRQLQDPDFIAELSRWPSGRPSLEPLPNMPWTFRRHQAVVGGGSLFVLSTGGDEIADWLRGGRALAEVLIAATCLDLDVSFANQPLQIPQTRAQLRAQLEIDGWPQLLMRVGREASDHG